MNALIEKRLVRSIFCAVELGSSNIMALAIVNNNVVATGSHTRSEFIHHDFNAAFP